MIYLLAFLMNLTTGLQIIGNPLLAIEWFDAGPLTLGVLGTLGAGTYACACLVSGSLVDRLGFRRILIISCVFLILIYPAILVISRLWHLFIIVILGSLGVSLFWPAMMRWVGEEERGPALRRRIGSFNICLISGVLAGNVICGAVFVLNGRYPYLLSAVLVFIILFLLLLERRRFNRRPAPPFVKIEIPEEERHIPGVIYIGWLANFASWFAIGSAEYLFPKLALDLGLSTGILAVLIAMIPLGEITVFSLLRRTNFWHYNLPALVFSQLMGIAGLFILCLTGQRLLFGLGLLLIGGCGGMSYFSSLFYSLHRQAGKGRKSGFHESILGLGVALGPIAGGAAAQVWNLRAPYLLAAVVFILSLACQVVIVRRVASRE